MQTSPLHRSSSGVSNMFICCYVYMLQYFLFISSWAHIFNCFSCTSCAYIYVFFIHFIVKKYIHLSINMVVFSQPLPFQKWERGGITMPSLPMYANVSFWALPVLSRQIQSRSESLETIRDNFLLIFTYILIGKRPRQFLVQLFLLSRAR